MNQTGTYGNLLTQGLTGSNPALVQLLGLCPLLAVSTTVINGLGLGLATIFVLCSTNLLVSLFRGGLHPNLRLPVFVLIIAGFVTVVEMITHAWFYDLYLSLGIFLPLIVTNCTILGRAESFASRNGPVEALADGLGHGLGFAAALLALGALREILGYGTLFRGAESLFGPTGVGLVLQVTPWEPLTLALRPPGAFLGLAMLVALFRWVTGPGNSEE